ncbi:uncharacterized protein LOC105915156 [Setaria italica]|uniref:uncharacterized protein LOC105915156 n=1 Tax=Setaria italica TaxID=4555 RepID=UPI000648C07D|nr:uncharacterized protein LOC105915156 [Setaria italica]
MAPHEFFDTNFLPFPERNRKPSVDEQFAHFVEMIQKIHINFPLLEAMQVPMYARYLKDILSNKRPMPTVEVVKLMEECSAAILNRLPEKKKDLGCPKITCMTSTHRFDHALYGLGACVSIMPKDSFILADFVVLDMDIDKESSLILGRPFVSTADARIDVGSRVI